MNDNGKPAFPLSIAEDINQVKQYSLERRLNRTDLTEQERKETEIRLGFVRIELVYIRGRRKNRQE